MTPAYGPCMLTKVFTGVVVVQECEESQAGREDTASPARGSEHSNQPQAGTLIVAPTSLLKQWQSEIETKVCKYMRGLCPV